MAIGSGLSGSFGWSKESTYGTRVAPAKFIRHRKCELLPEFNRVQGEGIHSGALGPRSDRLVETHKQATASVEFDVTTLNMVQLWENLMGTTTSSTQQSSTAAYSHVFTLADNVDKAMTLQTNVALRGGTNKAKEVTGAKATSATFSCGVGEMLTCAMEFDGQSYSTAQTLASPSYVSGIPYHFGQGVVKMGTFSSEAQISGVRAMSLTVNRGMDTEAFQFGATIKQQPVLNALTEISGTIEADYLSTANFEDVFTGLTFPSLVWVFTGAVIESSQYNVLNITIPSVTIEGPGVSSDGYDVPRTTWDWRWVYDGTNLPTISQKSTETSV